MTRPILILLSSLGVCLLTVCRGYAQSDAHEQVVALFEHAQIVFLGERHWSKQDSDFRIALVNHSDFAKQIDDVVIEFGNVLYQDLLDAYFLDLETVSDAQLSQVWRNTTQTSGVWDSPIYEQFLRALRKVNEGLPQEARIRVVVAGPPIDWSKVEVYEDKLPFQNRGWSMVRQIEREVLAKDRKALVVVGGGHVQRQDDEMDEEDNLIRRLEQLYPDKRFAVVIPVTRAVGGAGFADFIPGHGFPAYIKTEAEPFKHWEAEAYLPGTIGTLAGVADGLIYFGPVEDERVGPEAEFYRKHAAYSAELKRRRSLKRRLPRKSYN